jgi:hypothetical protein
MDFMSVLSRLFPVLLSAAGIAGAQNERKLTARELFYTPVAEKNPAADKTKPTPPKAVPPKAPKTADKGAKGKDPAQTPSGSGSYVPVSDGEVAGPPLALRYSLLKQNSDGEYVEVAPDSVFHSGDRIKVSIESNDGAHLYIVQQGSSKAWNVLFPNTDMDNGNNRVDRGRPYQIPAGGRFTFDEQPGTERLFIVLSRRPEADLEKLIYNLSGKPAAPAATPAAPETSSKMMLAQSKIDDSLVSRLRSQMASRDLVFERVDETKPAPGGKREKAMYYGTGDRTSRARIVVDLNLRHQ